MLPPQQPLHPPESAPGRRTSTGSHTSMSLSPRSQNHSLPYPTSRPGSAAGSAHPFPYDPRQGTLSPVLSARQMSDDQPRPTSSSSASGRRYTEHAFEGAFSSAAYRPRHTSTPGNPSSSYAPRFTPQPTTTPSSPSTSQHTPYTPHHSAPPRIVHYNPHRQSAPSSILRPIYPDEIVHLRQLAHANNPLRQKPPARRSSYRAPPEPTPTPRRSLPDENDHSYFPPQATPRQWDDRRPSMPPSDVSYGGPPSSTPGAPHSGYSHYPPNWEAHTPGGNRNGERSGWLGKRRARDEEDAEYERTKRVLSGPVAGQAYTGKVTVVAEHYNSRPEVGVERREFSPIIGLKKFNNWIKSVLIGKFAHRPRGKVLDVGCGKGGDLNKWKQARIGLYVGLDVADQSVQQAADRYRRMPKPGFDAFFYAHDCFSNPLSDVLSPELQIKDLYDNVTMQFCMHYAFENAAKARMMIENVSRYLRRGGIFIGTIPNAELLLERLNELPDDDEELRFGNSCYSIQFTERQHKGVYGHDYRFYLTDAVEDVPEYLVDWENFVSLASESGLRLIYKKAFHEILQEEKDSRDFGPLLGKMGVLNEYGESAMDADQWEAANLYMGFAFEKM
ncbi:mRNA cap guanine-N7 methyltransferase [Cryptococcus neoformans A2-102-5]|nr:mRNA cap guanine-N7 methyltransferase [Cryptococcus neoformans var. grubii 125.91]OXG79399.1 mRNA cap guanine-N7 methyltransferase [Cryptococcus neoformans var. grubii D17-1]OXG92191.1 mRNA cap guanine-N7 methyltransferase [Cryptococcus neoformans var. grubii A2-102-5]